LASRSCQRGEAELFQIEPKRQGCKCVIVSKSLKKSGRFEVFSKTMQCHCYFFCFWNNLNVHPPLNEMDLGPYVFGAYGLNGKFPKRAVTKHSSQHSRPNWVVIGISFAFVGNSVAFWVSQTQKHDEQYLNCHLL